ncbi:MAG: 4-hydroxy-tetrahydrodipicolinate reductase [Thermotogota bacterium]|nr:4-hydroxy-tetrahydrodipicolinate reductase [Thermotogota bacterium]MDK2864533.1 4-hydroxy-tetrahydrodipicolinate reductase [Thermotogota bacterium]HCZ06199.1 4-hydroxy-tetrahydrodipicolinate reductase [Thermotogota bacterium]
MKFGVFGYSGRMGKVVVETFQEAGHELTFKADIDGETMKEKPDVIVDFSSANALDRVVETVDRLKCALVTGTTGIGEKGIDKLKALSGKVAVVQSFNFSAGITVLKKILREYSKFLSDWEVEIVEAHHKYKKDAPSGTAIALSKEIGRSQIPWHSLRMGGIPGDHWVYFANEGEVLEFHHRAISRKVFAFGALKAAEFAVSAPAGFYSFEEVLFGGRL